MTKYKLLHIPTGHYIKDGDGLDVIYPNEKRASKRIDTIIDRHGVSPTCNVWQWNKYNEDIGEGVYREEFEIIELGEYT